MAVARKSEGERSWEIANPRLGDVVEEPPRPRSLHFEELPQVARINGTPVRRPDPPTSCPARSSGPGMPRSRRGGAGSGLGQASASLVHPSIPTESRREIGRRTADAGKRLSIG
jgi:hypothetical protein